MSAGLAEVLIVGNLKADPVMGKLPSGDDVCNFEVAANTVTGSGNRRRERTTWFKIACFGNPARNHGRFLKKGNPVLIRGNLMTNEFGEPKAYTYNGKPRASYDIYATMVLYLPDAGGPSQNVNGQVQAAPQAVPEPPPVPEFFDEVPW